MRSISYLQISLLGVFLSQVSLADDPPSPSDPKPVAATPADPAAAVSEASNKVLDEAFQEYVKNYKVREKNGQKLYCRSEAPLGSRMQRTACLSEARIRSEVLAKQETRDAMIKIGKSPCSGNSC